MTRESSKTNTKSTRETSGRAKEATLYKLEIPGGPRPDNMEASRLFKAAESKRELIEAHQDRNLYLGNFASEQVTRRGSIILNGQDRTPDHLQIIQRFKRGATSIFVCRSRKSFVVVLSAFEKNS